MTQKYNATTNKWEDDDSFNKVNKEMDRLIKLIAYVTMGTLFIALIILLIEFNSTI